MEASHTSPGGRGLGESSLPPPGRRPPRPAPKGRALCAWVLPCLPQSPRCAGTTPGLLVLVLVVLVVGALPPRGAWPHLPLVARHLLPREEVGALPQQVLQPQLARLSEGLARVLHQVL